MRMLDTALVLVVVANVGIIAYCCAWGLYGSGCWGEGERNERVHMMLNNGEWDWMEAQITACRRQRWEVLLLLMYFTVELQVTCSFWIDREIVCLVSIFVTENTDIN